MEDLYDWIHDDITWCGNECSYTQCERNMANRLSKGRMYSAAMFKDTETCPLYQKGVWVKVHGYYTAGGDPAYRCSNCGEGIHVYGIEHPEKKEICESCGSHNKYL